MACMAGVRLVLKVAVLGELKTGKSSIITQYVDGKFNESKVTRKDPCRGIDFRQKDVTVDGIGYSYEIWDVPNWTLLDNLGLNFWKDISGCALVFDVTSAASFCILDKLYSSVVSVAKREDIPLVVVGNMADRESSVREVSMEMAESWCGKVGTRYFEVSAKTGCGVNEMFLALAEKAVLFYNHHHTKVEPSTKKSSRFSVQLPFVRKVTTKLRFGQVESISTINSDKDDVKDESKKESAASPPESVASPESVSSPSSSLFSSLPIHLRFPWHSKKTAEQESQEPAPVVSQVEELQRELEIKEGRVEMLQKEVKRYEKELSERTVSLELLRSQLEEAQRHLKEKAALCETIEDSNQILQIQVAELQAEQKGRLQASSCWEVTRQDIELNKTEIIGSGAWGYVVEGRFRGQKVAVKCLHNLICQPHFIQMIRREIGIMAQLRHPHLLLFMAVVLDNASGPLIITELLDTTLRRAYEKDQLQQSNIVGIFLEVAAALNYLHLQGSGIIHRDVSSANVLLERKSEQQWKAKLADFGSANLTRLSSTVGPGAMVYAAPEVRAASDVPQTPKVDVYSFGVLLTEVLLCQFPSTDEFKAMLETVKAVWPNAYPIAYGCTREQPVERPTMAMLLEQLNHLTLSETN